MTRAGAVAGVLAAGTEDTEGDAVSPADVLVGQGGCCPDRHVEAALLPTDALGMAVVRERVDDHQDRGVLLGPRRLHVQVALPERDAPVDPPQPVAGVEPPDGGELRAVAVTPRAVRSDQPDRLRRLPAGPDTGQGGQHRHLASG